MAYVSLYQVNWTAPAAPVVLEETDDLFVALQRFAPQFESAEAGVTSESGLVSLTGLRKEEAFPEANYLAIEGGFPVALGSGGLLAAAVRHAEVAATLELACPSLIARRVWQGVVQAPNSYFLVGEGPLRMTARPAEQPEEIQAKFNAARSSVARQSEDNRRRYRLASRWLMRGLDTNNAVDRLLSLYICLEIYPASGTADVPGAVCDFVKAHVAPALDLKTIKDRLGIGRIAGKRADIVHDGLAIVDVTTDRDFELRLRQLEATARYCVRSLGGFGPGTELTDFLAPPPTPAT